MKKVLIKIAILAIALYLIMVFHTLHFDITLWSPDQRGVISWNFAWIAFGISMWHSIVTEDIFK